MAQTAQRSQIPVASASAEAPPSPSQFPGLPSAHPPAASQTSPRPESTSSIPSYARASKAYLPEVPKTSRLAEVHPASLPPPPKPTEPAPAPAGNKTSIKNKRMSLPAGTGAGNAQSKPGKKGAKGPAARQGAPNGNGHRRTESEGQYNAGKKATAPQHPPPRPLSPRSSPLSATAPTFTFRPTAAPFVPPSASSAAPVAPAAETHSDHLSPLAPKFQPHSPVSDSAAEIAHDESPAPAIDGLGLQAPSSDGVESKETPPSPSFKEMALEAEDEARAEADGEGDLIKESEPVSARDGGQKEDSSSSTTIGKQEDPVVQVTESTPLPQPLVHALASRAEESQGIDQGAAAAEPSSDAPLPEPLVNATLNAASSDDSTSSLPASADIPTTLEAALPLMSAQASTHSSLEVPSESPALVQESEPLGEDSIPASAEEVVALPRLDDVLDVDEVETQSLTSSEPSVEKEEEEATSVDLDEESISRGQEKSKAQEAEQEATEDARVVKDVLEEKADQARENLGEEIEVAEEQVEQVKDSVSHGVEIAEERVEEIGEQIRESAESATEGVQEGVAEVEERVEPVVEQAKERIESGAEQVKESVEAGWEHTKEAAAAGVETVKDGAAVVADRAEETFAAVKSKVESAVESIKESTTSEDPAAIDQAELKREEAVVDSSTAALPAPSRTNSTDWEPFEAEDAEGTSTPTATPLPSTSSTDQTCAPTSAPSDRPANVSAPPTGLTRRSSSPPPPARDPSRDPNSDEAPSLTLAIVSAWRTASWAKKIPAILASIAINFGLPFVNGVMLGFGELFARNYIGVRLGWGNPFRAPSAAGGQRANTSSVGLRATSGRDHPLQGSAGVRTTVEAVESEAFAAAGAAAGQA